VKRSGSHRSGSPIAAGVSAVLTLACSLPAGAQPSADASDSLVKRGEYLVTVLGCNDCHTPLKRGPDGLAPDMSRMLSGHPESLVMPVTPTLPEGPWTSVGADTNTAWAGEWGVSFTANLTPDVKTGLGKWTYENFRDTIRTGRHLGRGRRILPPMPIPAYSNLTDEDLSAVFAFLQTIPAVSNRVPEPRTPTDVED
jgi:mono/diheme cytochrome c family protein